MTHFAYETTTCIKSSKLYLPNTALYKLKVRYLITMALENILEDCYDCESTYHKILLAFKSNQTSHCVIKYRHWYDTCKLCGYPKICLLLTKPSQSSESSSKTRRDKNQTKIKNSILGKTGWCWYTRILAAFSANSTLEQYWSAILFDMNKCHISPIFIKQYCKEVSWASMDINQYWRKLQNLYWANFVSQCCSNMNKKQYINNGPTLSFPVTTNIQK